MRNRFADGLRSGMPMDRWTQRGAAPIAVEPSTVICAAGTATFQRLLTIFTTFFPSFRGSTTVAIVRSATDSACTR